MALLAATAITVVAQIRDLQPEGGLAMPGQQDNRTVMNRDTTKTDKEIPMGLKVWSVDERFGDRTPPTPCTICS